MSRLEQLLWRPDVAAACCGRLIVSSLAAKLTVEMIDALYDCAVEHRKQWDGKSISLTVMKPRVAAPERDAREHVKVVQARPGGAIASVVVIDGTGFWAAAMRGVLASLALVSSRAPVGAATVRSGLELLQKHAEGDDLLALETDIVAFRVRHIGM